ncbi:MauE/DoxX family redox-associated membrane protein [Chitinophaga defluvii]|uniref:MauE/DoxX family redox-associated membrane protein n=1 Tax=Chitinophaga defluvii TaxID=3163343 RepID=A0ABV2TEF8_9BACT
MKRSTLIDIICYVFFLLFVYTSLSKWFNYPLYIKDLHRSPLLGPFAGLISIIIPLSELIIAGMLLFARTRKWGLYGALTLMVLFTGYVGYVLGMTTERPCSCGGIIRLLTWPQHMVFNILLTVLSIMGIIIETNTENDTRSNNSNINLKTGT